MEAGDVYTAGLKYELIPIMAERYNLDTTHYYVVAVSQEDDPDTDVVYLRGLFIYCSIIFNCIFYHLFTSLVIKFQLY